MVVVVASVVVGAVGMVLGAGRGGSGPPVSEEHPVANRAAAKIETASRVNGYSTRRTDAGQALGMEACPPITTETGKTTLAAKASMTGGR